MSYIPFKTLYFEKIISSYICVYLVEVSKKSEIFFIIQNATSTRLSQLCVTKTQALYHRGEKKLKQLVPSRYPNLVLWRVLLRKLFAARHLLPRITHQITAALLSSVIATYCSLLLQT